VFSRAQILSRNVERLGVKNAVVLSEYPETLAEYFPEYFDKILVDAPCSGEGMFRKNAEEALSEWSEENVAMCAARQKEILDYAFRMLKAGGKLVYSTCTFSEAEDEEQTENFLALHAEMRLLAQKKLYPHKEEGEGHFAALFEKEVREKNTDGESHFALLFEKEVRKEYAKGEDTIERGCFQGGGKSGDGARGQRYSSAVAGARPPRTLVPRVSKTAEKAYREFERDFFFRPFAEILHEAGNFLYSLPKECFDFGKLNVLRAGVRLGEMKNGRFEPSHSLAMCVSRKECRNVVSIPSDDPRTDKFLRGETVGAEECKNGWCIVCIDGYPVGLGKAVNGTIKNHIPKGLRKFS
ncbi:MAG: RsmF rRNA methyltransferase first C-terminal domain-containing protein, partial [Christensenellaceae bacterium]